MTFQSGDKVTYRAFAPARGKDDTLQLEPHRRRGAVVQTCPDEMLWIQDQEGGITLCNITLNRVMRWDAETVQEPIACYNERERPYFESFVGE